MCVCACLDAMGVRAKTLWLVFSPASDVFVLCIQSTFFSHRQCGCVLLVGMTIVESLER